MGSGASCPICNPLTLLPIAYQKLLNKIEVVQLCIKKLDQKGPIYRGPHTIKEVLISFLWNWKLRWPILRMNCSLFKICRFPRLPVTPKHLYFSFTPYGVFCVLLCELLLYSCCCTSRLSVPWWSILCTILCFLRMLYYIVPRFRGMLRLGLHTVRTPYELDRRRGMFAARIAAQILTQQIYDSLSHHAVLYYGTSTFLNAPLCFAPPIISFCIASFPPLLLLLDIQLFLPLLLHSRYIPLLLLAQFYHGGDKASMFTHAPPHPSTPHSLRNTIAMYNHQAHSPLYEACSGDLQA